MHGVSFIGWTLIVLALSLWAAAAHADVVAVVSAKSAVIALTKIQVADIFLGRTNRFPDGSPAVPIDLAEGTGARDEFYTQFTGKSAAQLKAHWSKIIFTGRGQPPKAVSNGIETLKLLAQKPSTIGYIERNRINSTVRVVLTR